MTISTWEKRTIHPTSPERDPSTINYYPREALAALRNIEGSGTALFERKSLITQSNIPTERVGRFGVGLIDEGDGRLTRITATPASVAIRSHCQATSRGIAYEAPDARVSGLYDPLTRRRFEFPFPEPFQYIHTGLDPEGRLWFYENSSDWDKFDVHDIYALVGLDREKGDEWLRLTGTWPTYGGGQKAHFHPQLTPDRKWIMFTGGDPETETCHIFLLDVSDLKDSQGISGELLSRSGENDIVR